MKEKGRYTMTLTQIQYILAVADAGSMNRAAEQLFISQPTLTSAVKALEEEFGITIFHRTSHGVKPTNEGLEFLRYARQLDQQANLIRDRYDHQGQRKKKFYVSTQHYSFATKAFTQMVSRHSMEQYDYAIKETKTINVINDVGDSSSEIGILFLSQFNRKFLKRLFDERDLEFHPLTRCVPYVYLYRNHPLAKKERITNEDLQEYPSMGFDQGAKGSLYLAEEIQVDAQFKRTVIVNDRATMLNLMRAIDGFTLCSGIICQELNGDDYIAVPYETSEEDVSMEIGYITRRKTILSEVAQDYIRELESYLGGAQKVV